MRVFVMMTSTVRSYGFAISKEPAHDKTNKMACVPSEDSDQPEHPPSLTRVFAVHSVDSSAPIFSSCGQR